MPFGYRAKALRRENGRMCEELDICSPFFKKEFKASNLKVSSVNFSSGSLNLIRCEIILKLFEGNITECIIKGIYIPPNIQMAQRLNRSLPSSNSFVANSTSPFICNGAFLALVKYSLFMNLKFIKD